jgi:hypothetical protein
MKHATVFDGSVTIRFVGKIENRTHIRGLKPASEDDIYKTLERECETMI